MFLDGSYVSKTDISDINTGDTFQCTLGIDTSVRVVHTLISSSTTSTASSFVEQYKTTTYTSTTTITNRHTGDYPIQIVERSSLPVASPQDTRIKVFLKKPEGLAEGEEGVDIDLVRSDGFKVKWGTDVDETKDGKKSGKFIWNGSVDPGKEAVLVSEWEVRAPVDVEWTERSSVSCESYQPENCTLTIKIPPPSKWFVPPLVYHVLVAKHESQCSNKIVDPFVGACRMGKTLRDSNFLFSSLQSFRMHLGCNTLGRATRFCVFLLDASR